MSIFRIVGNIISIFVAVWVLRIVDILYYREIFEWALELIK